METALITGASSGIGLELARIMARNNINLVITARSEKELVRISEELKKQYNVNVKVLIKDLSVISSALEIFEELQKENIEVDILVNNAGFGDFGPFIKSDWDKNYRMIELNIAALTCLTHLFLKRMTDRGKGRILNISSTAAFQPGPMMAVYYATKAFVQSFSEAMANELKGSGVTLTVVCPGATISGFQKAASMEHSRISKLRKLPASREVAEFAYDAMMKGKTVAIHGALNKILAFAVRFIPRSFLTGITGFIQEKTKV